MSKAPKPYRIYRALLYLYPKAHRKAYGEQMVQTLDDILADQHDISEKIMVWIRVVSELPLNVIEENINNLGEMSMGKLSKISSKQLTIGAGVVILVTAGVVLGMHLRKPDYTPTSLAKVEHAATLPKCLQTADNPNIPISAEDRAFIENNAAGSIIDVPAGTNVTAYFKTYDGTTATGSSVYSGKFGSYNFSAKKVADNSTNSYVGGWKITRLEACR